MLKFGSPLGTIAQSGNVLYGPERLEKPATQAGFLLSGRLELTLFPNTRHCGSLFHPGDDLTLVEITH